MRTLKIKKYIKENQKTMKYECAICNYIAEKPYTCNGLCGQTFCFQCMTCIQKNANECPFRCSKPFELTECKQIELEFRCPFNPEECAESIPTLNTFYNHSDCCQYVPFNWKQRQENFKGFRCDKGHDLFYMDDLTLKKIYGYSYYQKIMNKTCVSCSEKALCRTICPKCSQKDKHYLYCTSCRKPPCTRATCLYSHPLNKLQIQHRKSLMCDFCGTAAYLLGPIAFRDQACNFDICEVCYVGLPENHELVPFKMAKDVINHLIPQIFDPFEDYDDSDDQYVDMYAGYQPQVLNQPIPPDFDNFGSISHSQDQDGSVDLQEADPQQPQVLNHPIVGYFNDSQSDDEQFFNHPPPLIQPQSFHQLVNSDNQVEVEPPQQPPHHNSNALASLEAQVQALQFESSDQDF